MTVATEAPSLVVAEVFGPTFQGEGLHLGQRAAFIRLGGCNLTCSWCDTAYTWDASRHDLHSEMTRVPVDDIVAQVQAMEPQRVVISGGEPLLWQDKIGWEHLLTRLVEHGLPVDVETNGTIAPNPFGRVKVDLFTVSPKLAHSGIAEHQRIRPPVLVEFARLARRNQAILKVVVETAADVASTRHLAGAVRFPLRAVWVMPQATTVEALQGRSDVADAALEHGLNYTTRLHVLTWGTERAR